ncbi:unnamed protein product [Ixodes hexagonus]
MRYAVENSLIVAMPHSNKVFNFGLPGRFRPDMVQDLSEANMIPNVITMHMRFDRDALLEMFPRETTAFVTILRNPVDLFRSLYDYYSLRRFYNNASLEEFVRNNTYVAALEAQRFSYSLGFNQLAFDLGMDPSDFSHKNKMDDLIATISSTFDVVMIAERFVESLVLLADKLCWPFTSVVALRKNELSVRSFITDAVRAKLIELNMADSELYRFFADRLERELTVLGKARVQQEASMVSLLTGSWYERCIEKTVEHRLITHRLKSSMETDKTCHWLALSEMNFSREVRLLQTREARRITGYFYE